MSVPWVFFALLFMGVVALGVSSLAGAALLAVRRPSGEKS